MVSVEILQQESIFGMMNKHKENESVSRENKNNHWLKIESTQTQTHTPSKCLPW